MEKLMSNIGYKFKDTRLLREALTHSSYANENPEQETSNERLEFLGDSVLSLVTTDYLFRGEPGIPEGELSRKRAAIVCEQSLYLFARSINLGEHIRLGRGEKLSGGSERPSVLADAMEALIAAVYLDGGFDEAKDFVHSFIGGIPVAGDVRDHKTLLQEITQSSGRNVRYSVINESGPDHDKTFTVEARLGDGEVSTGTGRSKKAAEQNAAKNALEMMGY